MLAAAFLVPTLAATLYGVIGRPDLPDQPLAAREEQPGQTPGQPDVQQMVAGWRPGWRRHPTISRAG